MSNLQAGSAGHISQPFLLKDRVEIFSISQGHMPTTRSKEWFLAPWSLHKTSIPP